MSHIWYFAFWYVLDNYFSVLDDDFYIINEQSHTVYFVDGITADKKAYHSLPIKYKDVSQGIRPAVTSITAKTVYIPTGGVSVDLKDYLEFNSSEGKNGVPRTLTFTELTRHWCRKLSYFGRWKTY